MTRYIRTIKGFTLVEVLVYTALLVLIVTIVSSFIVWAMRIQTKSKAIREVSTYGNRVMEYMLSEIREAKGVYTPTSVFHTNPGQLSLETTKYLPTGEITTYIDFYQCDNRICVKKENQAPVALTPDNLEVTHLEFQHIVTEGISSIKIHLILEQSNPQNNPEFEASVDISATASVRAH